MSSPHQNAAAGFLLPDQHDAADLATYVSRARSVDPQAAVRLQGSGRVLAVWVSVIHPAGLLDTAPVVLGLRTVALAEHSTLDLTVAASAITDRLARIGSEQGAQDGPVLLSAPPQQVSASWAGIVAPRTGWSALGTVPADRVREVARAGVQAVSDAVPADSGAAMVQKVRSRVWGASSGWGPQHGPEIPDGAAFALDVLGFVPAASTSSDPVPASSAPAADSRGADAAPTDVHVATERTGQWLRLSTVAGHVLVKLPR